MSAALPNCPADGRSWMPTACRTMIAVADPKTAGESWTGVGTGTQQVDRPH
jgi:hypothetical protein